MRIPSRGEERVESGASNRKMPNVESVIVYASFGISGRALHKAYQLWIIPRIQYPLFNE